MTGSRSDRPSAPSRLTPGHVGGSGAPLVCLHGFADTWRTWALVLPILERSHRVHAPTLPGHAGGPPAPDGHGVTALVDAVERLLDEADLAQPHLVGSSLGGFLALALAARGRAASVVALAPAGGWLTGDGSRSETLALQRDLRAAALAALPQVDALVATSVGRRIATALVTERSDHLPAALVADLLVGFALCPAAERMLDDAADEQWPLDGRRIGCPVRIVWGTADRLLPWPGAAARFRGALPAADWVELEGVGHAIQLDVPEVTAALVLEVTQGAGGARPAGV